MCAYIVHLYACDSHVLCMLRMSHDVHVMKNTRIVDDKVFSIYPQQIMREQDQDLGKVSQSVHVLGQMGEEIGNELDDHNRYAGSLRLVGQCHCTCYSGDGNGSSCVNSQGCAICNLTLYWSLRMGMRTLHQLNIFIVLLFIK